METLNALLGIDINYIIIGLMVLFYTLEQWGTTQFRFSGRPRHWLHNFGFQVFFTVMGYLWAYVTVAAIEWLNAREIGLLYLIQVPYWLKLILGLAMFDFVNYWFHRAAHRAPILWRFHRVHHSDSTMDASTNFRAHPIEVVVYFGISNIVAAGIFGLDLVSLGLFFLIVTPIFFIEHSNLRFPVWMDRTFGLVFTTPNFHKVHHEQDQHFTDSNYADIFILWDRLFGTFKYKPVEQIHFGLKEFGEEKQTFWYLLISPFISMKQLSSRKFKETKTIDATG